MTSQGFKRSNTSPGIITVFYARLDDTFMEIVNNLRRKKYHRTNQDYNFLTEISAMETT